MKSLKIMAILLVITIAFSLSACSKVVEKATEKSMEKAFEDETGSKVDISEDGVKIEADGNSYETGNELEWPKEAMGILPEPKGKVVYVMENEESKGGAVAINEYELGDAREYVEKLKEIGFKSQMYIEDSEGIIFNGKTDNNELVNFTYNISGKECSIIYSGTNE